LSLVGLILGCEQVPSGADEDKFLETPLEITFDLNVGDFSFDYFTKSFFATASATSPNQDLQVIAQLFMQDSLVVELDLNDAGLGADIQAEDNSYDMNWELPDTLLDQLSKTWKVVVYASSDGITLSDSRSLTPRIPLAPIIRHVEHEDTLYLPVSGLTLDTLEVTVFDTLGLDEIRDVSFKSIKPDGQPASGGNQIPLFDDGASVVLYEYFGIKITSGDKVEGDGVYSLTLPLSANDLPGTYYWTFTARNWEGLSSTEYTDSLVVMAGMGTSP
jgi:hypothetical protein